MCVLNVQIMNVEKLLLTCLLIVHVFGHVTHRRSHLVHDKEVPQTTLSEESRFSEHSQHKDICQEKDTCTPFVQCPAHIHNEGKNACKTIIGRAGVCCSSGQNHTSLTDEKFRGREHIVKIDPVTMNLVARHSQDEVTELKLKEANMLADGHFHILRPGSASYEHFRNFKIRSKADFVEIADLASRAMEIALATRDFKNRQGLTNKQIEFGMFEQDLRPTPLGGACPPKPVCPLAPVKYRRIDGKCNNFAKPAWGTGMTPYARLLPPSYQDGIWIPRTSVNGHPLASPRHVSTTVFSDKDVYNHDYTLMVMQFGQFLSHDITQSIETSFGNGSAISCCAPDGSFALNHEARHYACMPIDIPTDDSFYKHFKQRCMNFVRSILAPRQDCTLGYAQQMNRITHFIDGSSIYGSTPERTGELRSFQGGMLRPFIDFGRHLLPLSLDSDACLVLEKGSSCFMSGDTRTNQMISLVAVHLIFFREHNRVARELSLWNPHWADEKIFLEARHIVTAELQVITYKEYLPALLGDIAMEEFHLNLGSGQDYSHDYDASIEPAVTNEFAAAAFRYGHSSVDGILRIFGKERVDEMISIPEVMFQPGRLRKFFFLDKLLSTLTTESAQEVDGNLVEGLTKYMFRAGNPFGLDLASINIQRGRDHGLRPYNDYRELVGLSRLKDFGDLNPEYGEMLRRAYASVDDIDLWVGGLLEEKAPGSLVGYTFRDIIADQFFRLKHGDRYFFEHDPIINPGSFTPDQLSELRKASMARLICDNSDGVLLARQAFNSFRKPGVPGNEYVDCAGRAIPSVDLLRWRE